MHTSYSSLINNFGILSLSLRHLQSMSSTLTPFSGMKISPQVTLPWEQKKRQIINDHHGRIQNNSLSGLLEATQLHDVQLLGNVPCFLGAAIWGGCVDITSVPTPIKVTWPRTGPSPQELESLRPATFVWLLWVRVSHEKLRFGNRFVNVIYLIIPRSEMFAWFQNRVFSGSHSLHSPSLHVANKIVLKGRSFRAKTWNYNSVSTMPNKNCIIQNRTIIIRGKDPPPP